MLSLVPIRRSGLDPNGALRTVPALSPLVRDFDRAFEGFLTELQAADTPLAARPEVRVEVAETDEQVIVWAEVPGIPPSELDLNLRDDEILVIAGEKKSEPIGHPVAGRVCERWFGSFQRLVPLPCQVDPAGVEAVHRDGVVTITMPKSERARTKRIAIRSA